MKFARPPWLPIAEYVDMIDRGRLTEREAIKTGREVIKQHPEFANALIDQYVSEEIRAEQKTTPRQAQQEQPAEAEPVEAAASASDPPSATPQLPRRSAPALPPPKTDEEQTLELFPSVTYRVSVAPARKRPVPELGAHLLDTMLAMAENTYWGALDDGMAKAASKWVDKLVDVRTLHRVFHPLMKKDETIHDVIARLGAGKIKLEEEKTRRIVRAEVLKELKARQRKRTDDHDVR